jgi:hypothetical protein
MPFQPQYGYDHEVDGGDVSPETVGIAITMTSSLTRKPHPTTFYYNPLEILAGTFEFCSNVRLDHTYLPHDFALFCYKKATYDF